MAVAFNPTCGIIAKTLLKLCKGISAVSIPSIVIVPVNCSDIRNKAAIIELLPAPVRPTIPI